MAGEIKPRRERAVPHNAWTNEKKALFLEALAATANVTYAAKRARKAKSTAYSLRDRDPAFAAAWREAVNGAVDELFAVLLRRAKNGSARTVKDGKGKVVKTVHSYSDRLGEFILRHYKPSLGQGAGKVVAVTTIAARREISVCGEVSRLLRDTSE